MGQLRAAKLPSGLVISADDLAAYGLAYLCKNKSSRLDRAVDRLVAGVDLDLAYRDAVALGPAQPDLIGILTALAHPGPGSLAPYAIYEDRIRELDNRVLSYHIWQSYGCILRDDPEILYGLSYADLANVHERACEQLAENIAMRLRLPYPQAQR